MKKFLKVLIIILLVIGVIGGTSVFFFKKYKEKNNTTESFANFLSVENNKKFNDDIVYISNEIVKKSDATDTRLDLIINVNKHLDEIAYVLSTYYVQTETKINNEEIAIKFNDVKTRKSLLVCMMDEYKIKSTSKFFDKHLGLNDFYFQASCYLTEYANLANLISANINVNKTVDAKFNVFEVYCNLVKNTFGNLNYSNLYEYRIEAGNTSGVVIMNNRMHINNLFLTNLSGSQFSSDCNNFNYYYSNCDKNLFIQNLIENIANVSSSQQSTNEKIATYYFKLIMGL